MASSIAAAHVFIDHQEQESSSSIPAIHLPTNEQLRRNNGNGNSNRCFSCALLVFCLIIKFLQNGYMIYLNEVKEYSYFYMVETFILVILVCLLLYAAWVPQKLYLMKIVSFIFAILFIMEFIMIVLIVDSQCYSSYENDVLKLQTKHVCTGLIIDPVISAIMMFLSSILTFITYSFKNGRPSCCMK